VYLFFVIYNCKTFCNTRAWNTQFYNFAIEITVHFVEFCDICPTNAQYILTISVSNRNLEHFDVYISSSGNLLLCMLKLQINNMKHIIQVVATNNQ
jgi:hypothetical protein